MLNFEILGARYDADHERIEVIKEITNDDGTTYMNLHMFNKDILEWRAAEYDIADVDTLIDIVIHEPFIQGTDVYQVTASAARDLHLQKINEAKVKLRTPSTNKTTTKTKLASLGIAQVYLDAVDNDHIAVIKNNCDFAAETISINKEYVAKERATHFSKEVPTQKVGKINASEIRRKLLRESESLARANSSSVANNVFVPNTINKSNHVQMIMRGGKIVKE